MSLKNYNRDQISRFWSSSRDIKMSTWQYHDMVDAVLDSRLTAQGIMKFKRMYEMISMNLFAVPVVAFPFAWAASKWLQGYVNRGIGSTRMNFFSFVLFYPFCLMYGFTRPIPRKLYTDIIADSGSDGVYVREVLKFQKPGLWQKLSQQLYQLGYNYPQMHEYKGTQFPTSFVHARVI